MYSLQPSKDQADNVYKILRIHRLKRFAISEKYQCMLEEIFRISKSKSFFQVISYYWIILVNNTEYNSISIADIIEVNFKFK